MKSYPWCSCHHSVGEDEQIQAYQLENVLKEPNDLQSEHILETEKCRNSLKVSSELLKHPGKSVQGAKEKWSTCLQSSPTLKMAACQQILRDPSGFSSPSSRESEGQRRPSLSSSLTPQRFTLNLAR